jgi:hypothetical protein
VGRGARFEILDLPRHFAETLPRASDKSDESEADKTETPEH